MSTTENYEKIAGNLKIETRPFIDGKYVDPIDGQSFEKINPATGEIIANVAKCNDKDVQKSVVSAILVNFSVFEKNIFPSEKLLLIKLQALSSHIAFISSGTPGKVRIVKFSIGCHIIPGAVPLGLLII